MSNRVRFPVITTTYIDMDVDSDTDELALIEAEQKFNEMNIATANIVIIQTDGTVHIDRADDWKIGEYEFINEED